MDKSVAVKKLHKILGKGFGYRVDPRALKREQRDQAREELAMATAERNKARQELYNRELELKRSDEEYQKRLAAKKVAEKRHQEISAKVYREPITVGVTQGAGGFRFFLVKATGDNWEEVLEKVSA